jgi:hypothetical protein
MVTIPTSAQPTTAQGPSASIPPQIAPGIPNANTQPQETGPVVLTGRTIGSLLGGDTSLRVGVNPDAGPWKIYTPVEWSWRAVGTVPGPNNTFVEKIIGSRTDSRQLEGYLSTDGKSFFVTDFNIVDIVSRSLDEENDISKVSRINNIIIFRCNHDDTYVKFNETNNPDDIIETVIQSFNITVILK